MEKVTVHTNDFSWTENYYTKAHIDVLVALHEGKAVKVAASCIGHTRAAMVEEQAKDFFDHFGAVAVESNLLGTYYALK